MQDDSQEQALGEGVEILIPLPNDRPKALPWIRDHRTDVPILASQTGCLGGAGSTQQAMESSPKSLSISPLLDRTGASYGNRQAAVTVDTRQGGLAVRSFQENFSLTPRIHSSLLLQGVADHWSSQGRLGAVGPDPC